MANADSFGGPCGTGSEAGISAADGSDGVRLSTGGGAATGACFGCIPTGDEACTLAGLGTTVRIAESALSGDEA